MIDKPTYEALARSPITLHCVDIPHKVCYMASDALFVNQLQYNYIQAGRVLIIALCELKPHGNILLVLTVLTYSSSRYRIYTGSVQDQLNP